MDPGRFRRADLGELRMTQHLRAEQGHIIRGGGMAIAVEPRRGHEIGIHHTQFLRFAVHDLRESRQGARDRQGDRICRVVARFEQQAGDQVPHRDPVSGPQAHG